jgi:hypothetical protein
VSLDLDAPAEPAFARELQFRAALWDVELAIARRRAAAVIDIFGSDDAYARAIALALVRETPLVVLDRPPPQLAPLVHAVAPGAAILELRVAAGSELPLASDFAR